MVIKEFANMAKTRKDTKISEDKRTQVETQAQHELEKSQNEISTGDSKSTVDEKAIERNKYVFELVNMWIGNADNKINIAFAMLSALVAVVVFITDNLLSDLPISQNACPCYLEMFHIAAVIAALCFCLSIFFYVCSIIPRLTSDKTIKNKLKKIKDDKKPKYSIFYDEIKDFEKADEFVKAAKAANAEMFNEEILKEIYYNSGICSKKMYWFRKGAIASFVTIALSLLAALFYFLYAIGF